MSRSSPPQGAIRLPAATGGMLGAVAEILHRLMPVLSIDLLVWVVVITTAVLLMKGGYAVVWPRPAAFF